MNNLEEFDSALLDDPQDILDPDDVAADGYNIDPPALTEEQSPPDNGGSDPRHPSIPFFNQLFADCPELITVMPPNCEKQSVARPVIRKGNRWHNVGYYASRLNRAWVPYESSLEKQACALFESEPGVIGYRTQPYPLMVPVGNKSRVFYPDFEITTRTGLALVDVKFHQASLKRKFLERADAIQNYCVQRGMGYTVLTERDIKVPRMYTSLFLTAQVHGVSADELREAVWTWLFSLNSPTFADVFAVTKGYPSVSSTIAELTLDGHLHIDWEYPIWDQPISLVIEEE